MLVKSLSKLMCPKKNGIFDLRRTSRTNCSYCPRCCRRFNEKAFERHQLYKRCDAQARGEAPKSEVRLPEPKKKWRHGQLTKVPPTITFTHMEHTHLHNLVVWADTETYTDEMAPRTSDGENVLSEAGRVCSVGWVAAGHAGYEPPPEYQRGPTTRSIWAPTS